MGLHVFHDLWKFVDAARSRTGIDQRVVHDHRHLKSSLAHLLINRPNTVDLFLACEPFEDRTIYNRVEDVATLCILLHLLDQVVGALGISISHDSLNHAAEGDARRLDVAAAHLLPATPNPS